MTMTKKLVALSLTLMVSGSVMTASTAMTEARFRAVVDAQSGFLLGGSLGTKWLSAKTTAAKLKGGEAYRVLSLSNRLLRSEGSKPQSEGAPCEDTLFVELKPKIGELALSNAGHTMPRRARILGNNSPTYRAIVSGILKKHGLKPNVKITKILRVDLEGDGEDEVLISATNHKGNEGQADRVSSRSLKNEYSILCLRKVVKGKVQTQMLSEEYFTKDMNFNAPDVFTLVGTWDLNGDGKLEIVARGRYYEGNNTTVYEMRGNQAVRVLAAGCGA